MANEMHDVATGTEAEAPAGTTAPPVAKSLDEMTDSELIDAALAMEKQFPEPNWEDCRPDGQWFMDNWNELFRLYPHEFVAIHGKAVIAHGTNSHRVLPEAARKLNISPQRFILEPLWPHTRF